MEWSYGMGNGVVGTGTSWDWKMGIGNGVRGMGWDCGIGIGIGIKLRIRDWDKGDGVGWEMGQLPWLALFMPLGFSLWMEN